MKRKSVFLTLGAVIFFSEAAGAADPVTTKPQVVGQALVKLEVPGKIAAVLWTRRDDHFTLQIMRREEGGQVRVASRPALSSANTRFVGDLQVWLLKADGTVVLPTRKLEAPTKAGCIATPLIPKPCLGYETLYSFPIAAGAEAVAVAMSLGDLFAIEKLPVLPQ